MPAAVVGAAGVADLAGADEIVKRAEGFIERREGVEVVGLIEVDVIGAEAAQAALAGFDEVAARESGFVGAGFEADEAFGGDDDILAQLAQRLTEDFLRLAEGIDIGSVEQV